ncbi:MAG: hypothetical protein HPY54_02390 [Chthonomonadetes bacterium]|nr:hypothetical protein [Chthonomonadetes bacterium]
MSKSGFTRRQFTLMLVASTAGWASQGEPQQPAPQPAEAPPASDINTWLPQPMPAEQAQKVAEAIKSLQKTQERLRAYPLAEGSEPAFTFHPAPLREAKR